MTAIVMPRLIHHRHHYWSHAAGEVALRRSLLSLFVGVPAAALVWRIWSLLFVGPSAAVSPQPFDGWGRVSVQLPGTLLVVGFALAAVVLAARAAAGRVLHADEALAVTGAGLLLVLLVLATTVLHTVSAAPSETTAWVVRAAVLAVSGAVAGAAYLWARDVRR